MCKQRDPPNPMVGVTVIVDLKPSIANPAGERIVTTEFRLGIGNPVQGTLAAFRRMKSAFTLREVKPYTFPAESLDGRLEMHGSIKV